MRGKLTLVSLLTAVVASGLWVGTAVADTTFSDGTFNLAQYSVTTFQTYSGDSVNVTQTSNGNPGTAAQATIHLPVQVPTTGNAGAYLFNNNFVYDPAALGPIGSLDVTFNRLISINGTSLGQTNFTSLIMQNGRIYVANLGVGTNQQTGWLSGQQARLVASEYYLISNPSMGIVDPTSHPDFAGAPMTFGFRMQISSDGTMDMMVTIETDNVTYQTHSIAPPAPTVTWINWNQSSFSGASTSGTTPGTATGSLDGSNSITYSGDLGMSGFVSNWSWTPVSSFSGGNIGNNPPTGYGEITESGGSQTESITFSTPVHNPVLAVASLGQAGLTASLVFPGTEPFTIEAGGTQNNLGGSSIALCSGSTSSICGAEASGVIQFRGDFSRLTWTNPTHEYYDVITVGYDGTQPGGSTDGPMPAWTLVLFAVALLAVAVRRLSARTG